MKNKSHVDILRNLGFTRFVQSGKGRIKAYHPDLGDQPFILAISPNRGARTLQNTLHNARRMLGLSSQGREAKEGDRREKKPPKAKEGDRREKKPPRRQEPPVDWGEHPNVSAVRNRADELAEIDALMRQRP